MGYHFAKQFMRRRYTFTFLREPEERILSLYFFCRERNPAEFEIYRKAHDLDLRSFIEAGFHDKCVRMHIWNNQVWQLSHGYDHLDPRMPEDFAEADLLFQAKAHLATFSYVGFTETFQRDAAIIMRALSLPSMGQMPRMNETPSRPKVRDLPSTTRTLLKRLTVLDRELYEHGRKVFGDSSTAEK